MCDLHYFKNNFACYTMVMLVNYFNYQYKLYALIIYGSQNHVICHILSSLVLYLVVLNKFKKHNRIIISCINLYY